jgi:hypothetical protein
MAPQALASLASSALPTASATALNAGKSVANDFKAQWQNPSDIFSLLLLVGGDIIQKAMAQFNDRRFRPIAFSFGWVAYAFSALLFAVGHLKILPDPDCPSIVINCRSGYTSTNQSWILGRLIRHHTTWRKELDANHLVENALALQREKSLELAFRRDGELPSSPDLVPLRGIPIFVYRGIGNLKRDGQKLSPKRDWAWSFGVIVTIAQMGIAAIPAGLYKEWEILMITAAGTTLAYLTGYMHQVTQGGAGVQRKSTKTFALTEGNGSQNVFVIIGNGSCPDLDQLARVDVPDSNAAIYMTAALLVLWISLLITVTALRTNTWYMVGVGGLGMLQNVIVAGAPRSPAAIGIHARLEEVIYQPKVMHTLYELEEKYPRVGAALLPVLFQGPLRPDEVQKWEDFKDSAPQREVHSITR